MNYPLGRKDGDENSWRHYEGEDIEIFERDLPGAANAVYSKGQEIAAGMPLERCTTMNNNWGYNINSTDFKSVDEILTLLVKTASKDMNLLINVGPRADGSLPDESVEILKGMGVWMRRYGNESIKGTRGGFAPEEEWGVQTRKGNVIYLHILNPVGQLTLPYGKVASVTTFDGEKIKFRKTRDTVSFIVPERSEGEFDQIIKLTLK